MSEENKKKTHKDLPEVLQLVTEEEPKTGDTRKVTRMFKKGKTLYFGDYERPLKLTADIAMEVTEKLDSQGYWNISLYHIDTSKPLKKVETVEYKRLGLFRRAWRFFFGPSPLPEARLLK